MFISGCVNSVPESNPAFPGLKDALAWDYVTGKALMPLKATSGLPLFQQIYLLWQGSG